MKKQTTWNPIWEKIYRGRNWGKYPPEELIRFIAKNYYHVKNRAKVKILELGCGAGANIWYLSREGFGVYGIDGSKTAIIKAKQMLKTEKLKAELAIGSIEKIPWQNKMFDCVIDVDSLQCNSESDTKVILTEVYRVLKSGGKHFSITVKSGCWGNKKGEKIDRTTYNNINEGPFANMGIMRFADKKSLLRLYKNFKDINFEYSIRTMNNCTKKIAHWILTCKK